MELELHRLANGVRVALDPMPGLGTAALGVWQRVGARWEPAQHNGIAHLFEHMAFKGAGARDARQFAEAMENVGGAMNAGTGYERTSYYARVVAEHAPFALDMIGDILFAPHWAPDDLEKEKGVVAQERGEAFDVPDDRVFELHQAALYPDQPLGRPILGEDATLKNVSVETLRAFADAHMTPERVIVSIAGAFDRDAFLETAERRFGHLKGGPVQERPAAIPFAGRASEVRKLEQTHLVFSWPSPEAGSNKLFAARLMSEIFGGGMSSRLFQEVRETRGLVYAIDSFLDTFEDDGRLSVYAGCSAQNGATVAKIVSEQLAIMADHGPTDAELARAKAVARAQMLMGLEAPSARAEARVGQVLMRDRLVSFDEIRARLDAVTAEDVQAIARAALVGPACAAAIGPKAGHGALAAFQAQS
ncbi:MAG: insulinase family protein [Hyphomonadaceae bacterium JAD_PAG50586_4]|nr:MAG: insulinase family protein [Hyphomonadaceae bacterium JAD_PAG50586_4]